MELKIVQRVASFRCPAALTAGALALLLAAPPVASAEATGNGKTTNTPPNGGAKGSDGTNGVGVLDALATARIRYNEGRYEAAIEAATKAQQEPLQRDAATLILGRAGLERYRYTADPGDLSRAREALRSVDPSNLSSRDRTDLLIGMGEALYFDEAYRPAADLFESMLTGDVELNPTARDQVLDWWATAIDRYVRILPASERAAAYDHLIAHMEGELRRDSGSAAAAYWLAAAAFARGQVERAWNAAISGWVRALLTSDRGAALRPDLDRLVREAIIPERVRRLPIAGTPEGEQAQAGMLAEWELVKEKWTHK